MVRIERYFGFAVADYEAHGGFGDLLIKADSLEKVKKKLIEHKNSRGYLDEYWIFDMKTFKQIGSID